MSYNYLYGLTIQGIQSYIFETNRLKEIIGASEIIETLCTTTFNTFLEDHGLKGKPILQAAGNIRYATDFETAKKIFTDFHALLLEKAPGIPFSQAVVEIKHNAVKDALKKLNTTLRGQRNISQHYTPLGNMARSKQRRTGNFAYQEIEYSKEEKEYLDKGTFNKFKHKDGKLLRGKLSFNHEYTFPTEFSHLTSGGKNHWLALIHIDGNGMGNNIQFLLKEGTVDELSMFSKNVDEATKEAFNTAIQNTFIDVGEGLKKGFSTTEDKKQTILPFRPLILGGDDVTIIMRADFAIDFTKTFLREFENNTKLKERNNKVGLTACAGIAYIKEKFPFHYSANLAEELCKYAKEKSDREHSCIQFHKVQDSIFEDYEDIQNRELKSLTVNFITKPYYLHKVENKTISTIDDLKNAIKKLSTENAPRNKIREWIDACFNNPLMADDIKKRITEIKDYLPNENEAINYLTQLSIQKL